MIEDTITARVMWTDENALPCRENLGVGSRFRRARNDFHDTNQDDNVDLRK